MEGEGEGGVALPRPARPAGVGNLGDDDGGGVGEAVNAFDALNLHVYVLFMDHEVNKSFDKSFDAV